jgi:hypothetical protein
MKAEALACTSVSQCILCTSLHSMQGNDDLFPVPPGIPLTPHDVYEGLLDAYGFDGIAKWTVIPILVASFFVFRAAAYLALKYINYERR